VRTATPASQTGGCDFPVDPELDAPDAPVFWNPEDAPAVAQFIAPLPADLQKASLVRLVRPAQTRDEPGLTWARLDDGTVLVGAADSRDRKPFGILLPLDDDWPIRLAAAERLRATLIDGTADPPLTEQRRKRVKRALQTVDARRDGATYRAIATVFFGAERIAEEPWKTSSLKAQIARLAAHGHMLIDQGYRLLLQGRLS
jgi:hypothetical protein